MKFVELAADYVRQRYYLAHPIEIPILSQHNKGVFWVGYPKPSLWIVHADNIQTENKIIQDGLWYTWYQAKGRKKLRKIETDLGPFSSRYGFFFLGQIHDPDIFEKLMKIVRYPPEYLVGVDYVAPPTP
jgi:hypothetical protein